VTEFITDTNEFLFKHAIIIGKDNLQKPVLQQIRNLLYPAKDSGFPEIVFEYFKEIELIVNITKHELVPKHIPLTNLEKQEILKKYKVKESQLPIIKKKDPVARYFGLRKR